LRFALNRRLLECYEDAERGKRRWGESLARLFIRRVDQIGAAQDMQQLRAIRSLRLHRLTGHFDGKYAIDLQAQWRLIISWDEAEQIIHIEEVSNHYGD
jgi:plasmid maintenance system killer protein